MSFSIRWESSLRSSQLQGRTKWVQKCKYLERANCRNLWVNYIPKVSLHFSFCLSTFYDKSLGLCSLCQFSAGQEEEAGTHFFVCVFSNLLELSDVFISNTFGTFDPSWKMSQEGSMIHRKTGYPQGSQLLSPAELISIRCVSSCSETL